MPKVWVVRANGGDKADVFRENNYAGIGYDMTEDLTTLSGKAEIEAAYRRQHPGKSNVANIVGQIDTFLNQIKPGDHVVTPASEGRLFIGVVEDGTNDGKFFVARPGSADNHCNRRSVAYDNYHLYREELSVPFRYTLMAQGTVFSVGEHAAEFLRIVTPTTSGSPNPPKSALRQLLELDDKQTEALVAALLRAMGCKNVQLTGRSGDRGVDVRATLVVNDLASIELYVQVKRYKSTGIIPRGPVQQLRSAVPYGSSGVFVTTSDFSEDARQAANEQGFPTITLIPGSDFVDLLTQHWQAISDEFQGTLDLKPFSALD